MLTPDKVTITTKTRRMRSPSGGTRNSALSELFNLSDPTLDSSPRRAEITRKARTAKRIDANISTVQEVLPMSPTALGQNKISTTQPSFSAPAANPPQHGTKFRPVESTPSTESMHNPDTTTAKLVQPDIAPHVNFRYPTAMGDLRSSTALEERADEDCHPNLFHRLWAPLGGVRALDVQPLFDGPVPFHVPHTIIFDLGMPSAW
jgi:hypothetical protein